MTTIAALHRPHDIAILAACLTIDARTAPGGTYFFPVKLLKRHGHDLRHRHIDLLRDVVRDVRRRHPFTIHS